MFTSGNVTIRVADMNRAVRFYTEVLGLKLAYRHGDHFASVRVGDTLTIGLHPGAPEPGSGMSIGLELAGSINDAIRELESKGVKFENTPNEGKAGRFAAFHDPDGNSLYLAELNRRHVDQGDGKYPGT